MTLSVLGELFQRSKVVRAALVADLKVQYMTACHRTIHYTTV